MGAPLVRRSPTHSGQVVAAEQLTPRMRRVTVQCDAMVHVAIRPAQDIELLLREPAGRRVKRRYTIRRARPDKGELDLDVLLHGVGAGSAWGETAMPGDLVQFQGPRGKLDIRPSPWHVLCGDESSLPAAAAIAEALPECERSAVVIEVRDPSDELPIRTSDLRWVHRHEHPPGTPDLLVPAVSALDLPFAQAHAYLMGETRSMVALRAVLEGHGVPHDEIFLKGYWNIGRPDRIHGTAPS